jgi:hypothetical protein
MNALVTATVVVKMGTLAPMIVQTLLLQLNCLGAFPGTITGSGLMSFTLKLLPNKEVPSTGAYRQLLSEEKAKGLSRPLAKAAKGWAYAMSLPLLLEEVTVFLLFLANLLLCLTFSAAFLHAGGGGALKVTKTLSL